MPPKKLTAGERRRAIISLYNQGYAMSVIAKMLNMLHSKVIRIVMEHKTGVIVMKKRNVNPPETKAKKGKSYQREQEKIHEALSSMPIDK